MLSCPDSHEGLFLWWCVFVSRTWEQLQSRVCVCVFVCVIKFVCVEVCHKTWETECVCVWVMCTGLCVCQGTCMILSWIIADRDCSGPVWWYSPVQLWLTMTDYVQMWHGLDLLQAVTTLVLNVDLLMIFFLCVKGPVGLFGKKFQPMMPPLEFRRGRRPVCHDARRKGEATTYTRAHPVVCRYYQRLPYEMHSLHVPTLQVRFITDSEGSGPFGTCKITTPGEGRSTWKWVLIFTHTVCVCVIVVLSWFSGRVICVMVCVSTCVCVCYTHTHTLSANR